MDGLRLFKFSDMGIHGITWTCHSSGSRDSTRDGEKGDRSGILGRRLEEGIIYTKDFEFASVMSVRRPQITVDR